MPLAKWVFKTFFENIPEAKPFYSIQFNNDLNVSIFLLDGFWETNAKK